MGLHQAISILWAKASKLYKEENSSQSKHLCPLIYLKLLEKYWVYVMLSITNSKITRHFRKEIYFFLQFYYYIFKHFIRLVVAHAFNPSSRTQRMADHYWVWGQPGLHHEFQASQGYMVMPWLKIDRGWPYWVSSLLSPLLVISLAQENVQMWKRIRQLLPSN